MLWILNARFHVDSETNVFIRHALILCIYYKQIEVKNSQGSCVDASYFAFYGHHKTCWDSGQSKDGAVAAVSINNSLSRGSLLTNSTQEMLYTYQNKS